MSGTTSLPALLTGNPGRQNPGFQWSVICRHPPSQKVSLVAQLVKNLPAMRETGFHPWVGQIPWRRERPPTPVFWPGEVHGLYSPWGRRVRHD